MAISKSDLQRYNGDAVTPPRPLADLYGHREQLARLEARAGGDRPHRGNRGVDLAELTEEDRRHLLSYVDAGPDRGHGAARVVKMASLMGRILQEYERRYGVRDFVQAGEKQHRQFVKDLRNDIIRREDGRQLAPATKTDYVVALKGLVKHVRGCGEDDDLPAEIAWARSRFGDGKRKLPDDLLTEEEIDRMIAVASTPQDKAFIAMSGELGNRIGEALPQQIKHVTFDAHGAVAIFPRGKTGARRGRAVKSSPYLRIHIARHPYGGEPVKDLDAPLWFMMKKGPNGEPLVLPLTYAAATRMLKATALRAGVRKRVHPHLFRHTAATQWAKKIMPAQLEAVMGWVGGSKMTGIYVHMSGADAETAVLESHGIKTAKAREQEGPSLVPCPTCGFDNAKRADFCVKCAAPMVKGSKQKSALTELLTDPEVVEFLSKKLADHIPA